MLHDRVLSSYVSGYDPDGDPLSFSRVSGPTNGTLSLDIDGSYVYTPNPGYVGLDTFTFNVFDGVHYSVALGEISITVTNTEPTAIDDHLSVTTLQLPTVTPSNPLRINVLANDSDTDGDVLTLMSIEPVPNATVFEWNDNGDIVFVPHPDWSGIEVLYYTISDGAASSSATLIIRDISRTVVRVRTAYDGSMVVADSDLVQQTEDGVFTYAPPIPFEVFAFVPESAPSSYELIVLISDLPTAAPIHTGTIAPGSSYRTIVQVSPGLADAVRVSAYVVDALAAESIASDDADEPLITLEWKFSFATGQTELTEQEVKTFAQKKPQIKPANY